MTVPSQQELAANFINSMRGRYIIAQALNIAIGALEAVEPGSMREVSNISDMRFIRDNLFATEAYLASVAGGAQQAFEGIEEEV